MTIIPNIARPLSSLPVLIATDRAEIAIRAGTTIKFREEVRAFTTDTPLALPDLVPGTDYAVGVGESGIPLVTGAADANPLDAGAFAGFHFAPGGNAQGRAGGDDVPAINPFSIWDAGFRPDALDPRGMAFVEAAGLAPFWADIYFLSKDHEVKGTSRCGAEIADGQSLGSLDYHDAVNILAGHGKHLMTYDQFRAATFGVLEKSAVGRAPKTTGLDAERSSRYGLMQATGNMWLWGTDGDPDDPRPSIFGGSWDSGGAAGSRCADLGRWPGYSRGPLSARGASDHLAPA